MRHLFLFSDSNFCWWSKWPLYPGLQLSHRNHPKQIFGSKKHISAPSDQLEPHRSMFSTRKRCLIGIPIRGYQNFYSLPPKNWILGPKTAKFGPKLAFWAKYRHFCPIWSKAWPKNDANKLSRWFSVMLVPKLLLTPIKIRIFGPKTAKFGPKYAFLVILGQILPFLHILSNARPKNNVNKVPRWVFRYVGNKTFDFSSKKRIFCSKTTKFSPKLAFLTIKNSTPPNSDL